MTPALIAGQVTRRRPPIICMGCNRRPVHGEVQVGSSSANADYAMELAQRFKTLPDDWSTLRAEGLAFFRYSATTAGIEAARCDNFSRSIEALIANGYLQFDPIVYEEFLPVSAAGIFSPI
jgi:uncharacterized glyoxalase superfamily metalloenzyme YdcJ